MTNLSSKGRLAVRVVQVVAVVGLALYALQAAFAVCGSGASAFFEAWVYPGLILLGAGLCLVRGFVLPTERAAWLVLGGALVAWAGGDVYSSQVLLEDPNPPLPSPADALWLAFYPASYAAIVLLLRRRLDRFHPSLWLDGAVGGLAVAALGAALVATPVVTGSEGGTTVVATDLAYMMGDLLLLAFVVGLCALTGWRPGRPWMLIGGGLVLCAAADAFYLYQGATGEYMGGTVFATVWPAATLLLGCAAWQAPHAVTRVRFNGWRVLVMPGVFALVALGVLVFDQLAGTNPLAIGLATTTLVAVIVRMTLTFAENLRMVASSRKEAQTDALTGLGNRRRLMIDLDQAVAEAATGHPRALLLFDLDGFKGYNDTYGHPAGDALLARLGRRFADSIGDRGIAYRLGGDEFCALVRCDEGDVGLAAVSAAAALSEQGRGFEVGSSYGMVLLPDEATDASGALQTADRRLYAQKGQRQRSTITRQTRDVLLQALHEREPELRDHLAYVADLALMVGRSLGLAPEQLDELARAAELHDIGKMAVPDAILRKNGPLDDSEWHFMRQHTIVGERILSAAPALVPVARLVRASHEHFDGRGYPDGLAGDDIPLGARIVAVCDAFHAMTNERPYGQALPVQVALEELRGCAGQQFDPSVVEAFAVAVQAMQASGSERWTGEGAPAADGAGGTGRSDARPEDASPPRAGMPA